MVDSPEEEQSMKRMRRSLLMITGIAFVCSVLSIFPQSGSAFAEEDCPYMHHQCPPDFYDCCCWKGVRCDLNAEECSSWCNG